MLLCSPPFKLSGKGTPTPPHTPFFCHHFSLYSEKYMKSLPLANNSEVILNSLVVDELVSLKVGHGNLLSSPVGTSLSVGTRGNMSSDGGSDGLILGFISIKCW